MGEWPYPVDWYRQHTEDPLLAAARAVGAAADFLFCPTYVVDVGCAVGALLSGIIEHSGEEKLVAVGFDHPEAARIVRENDLWMPLEFARLYEIDLESEDPLHEPADLVVCTEVGEHLTPAAGRRLVKTLTSWGAPIVWSAAIPGQGGEEHVNEQPIDYWQALFGAEGYRPFRGTTAVLRAMIAPSIEGAEWYSRVCVYARPL